MRRLLIIAAALPLMAFRCSADRLPPPVSIPQLPELDASAREPCRSAELLTGAYADLVTQDKNLALALADCRAKDQTVVAAYEDARRLESDAQARRPQGAPGGPSARPGVPTGH